MRMRNSPFYLAATVRKTGMEPQVTQRFQAAPKLNRELPVLWDRMPTELKTQSVKRKVKVATSIKPKLVKRAVDPNDILSKLEAKEKHDSDVEDETKGITSPRFICILHNTFVCSLCCRR